MLIPLVGQIQYTRLEFDPGRGGFHVDGELFRGFSLLYGYGLSEAARLQQTWPITMDARNRPGIAHCG